MHRSPCEAVSPTTANLLMVALTILLAALVILLFQLPQFDLGSLSKTPSFLEIRKVNHHNEYGSLNYDSRVTLYHNGTRSLENDNLYAIFYRNDEKVACEIETLNGYNFVPSHHWGVQTLGGLGCSGSTWDPCEKIAIDFTDGTFRPGDLVTVEIYERPKNILISRNSRTA